MYDDVELGQRAAVADRDAWAAVHDLVADRLHDYAWSVTRDREAAQDVVRDTLATAARTIARDLHDPALLRPWLYKLCRERAVRIARRRAPGATAGLLVARSAAQRVVWEAAAWLDPRDRAVLELHLRHGLEGDALGVALGVPAAHATALVVRVRDHADRALAAVLVAADGDCPGLTVPAPLSRSWFRAAPRHVDRCDACSARRRRVASPLALLSNVPLLPAPTSLRGRVLTEIDGVLDDLAAAPAGRVDALRRMVSRDRVAVVAAAVGLTVLVIAGAVLIAIGTRGAPANVGLAPPEASTPPGATAAARTAGSSDASTSDDATTTTATTSATTTSAEPGVIDVLTASVDFATTRTETQVRFTNTGGAPLPWSAAATAGAVGLAPSQGTLAPGATAVITVSLDRSALREGDFATEVSVTAAGRGSTVAVRAVEERAPVISGVRASEPWLVHGPDSACGTARGDAQVADDSPVTVTLHWQQAGGPIDTAVMSGSGPVSAVIGPAAEPDGDIRWWVTARDERGNESRSGDQSLAVRPATEPCGS